MAPSFSYESKSKPVTRGVAGVVLAAGLSRRMGRPKQLLGINGRILLAHVLGQVCRVHLDPIILVLGHLADQIELALSGDSELADYYLKRFQVVRNPDYASGQASSIRCGLAALPAMCRGAMFIMGDQIGLSVSTLDTILNRLKEPIEKYVTRPIYGMKSGGPILWGRDYFGALGHLSADQGGRHILSSVPSEYIIDLGLPAKAMPIDIDTEEDYRRWLKRCS